MIILSMLGTGNYEKLSYSWKDKTSQTTSFFQGALLEWCPNAEVLICVTKEAKEKHGSAIQQLMPKARLIDIPSGKDEAEYWEIFNTIEQHIPKESKLVLDMTHGFRSLPTLALLAVSFLRAAKAVKLKYVLYGAYEARTDGVAPVFDLTPFVTMLDWASATNRFLETGDGRRFKELLLKSEHETLKSIGSELDKFTNSLLLNRTTEVSETARNLLKSISQAKKDSYSPQYQPFRLLETRLDESVAPIADENPIRSQFSQIVWYSDQQHYAQSIALAREWMISVRIWKTDGRFSEHKEERRLAEEWLSTFAKVLEHKSEAEKQAEQAGDSEGQKREKDKRLKVIPPDWHEFVQLWQKVSDQRNDYAHFGMRQQKSTTSTTLKKATSLPNDLRKAVLPLGLELPEPS